MFSAHPNTNFNFWITFILSSANAFNLDYSKILSFGKELKNYQTSRIHINLLRLWKPFSAHTLIMEKILLRNEKMLVTSISFSHKVFTRFDSSSHLTLYHTMMTFDAPEEEAPWRHCGKRRKCRLLNLRLISDQYWTSHCKCTHIG